MAPVPLCGIAVNDTDFFSPLVHHLHFTPPPLRVPAIGDGFNGGKLESTCGRASYSHSHRSFDETSDGQWQFLSQDPWVNATE